MFWIFNNKNIFSLLLVLIINFIIISSYNEEFPFYNEQQQKLINDACNKNTIFRPMSLAIEDIFTSIENELITISNEEYYYGFSIHYNNIYARDIICDDNIEIDDDNGDIFIMKFNNCNVLIEGRISYKNSDITTVDFGTFLSELKFKSIIFNKRQNLEGDMEVIFDNSSLKYNYNRNHAIFSSEIMNMTEQMDDIMDKIFDKFIEMIYDKLDINMELSKILIDTINNFNKEFSYFKGPGIYDAKKNITYIAYNNFDYESFVHIKQKIFFSWMRVTFEYALNHNVIFNEGYFTINQFVFEEDLNKDNRYDNCSLSNQSNSFNNLDNGKDIWNTIFNDFKFRLNNYRKIKIF